MSIVKNSVVSLHYEMYDANNQLLDKTEEPIAYLMAVMTVFSLWWKKRCTVKM